MSYLDQFLDLLSSPYGLAGILVVLFVLTRTNETHRRLHWFLFAFCGFSASLIEYIDRWGRETPALVFPLEQLREMGRPLTILILVLLLLIAFRSNQGWRSQTVPKPVPYLVIVQLMIVLKTIQEGSMIFAFLVTITFGLVVLMITKGPSRWLQDEHNFQMGVRSIAAISVIFIIVNLCQAVIDISPLIFGFGSFLGTTGNPQHAATLLMTAIPCYLFFIHKPHQLKRIKFFWTGLLVITGFILILTGSRTGILSTIFAILIFYRYRGRKFVRLGLAIAIILAISWLLVPSEQGAAEIGQLSIETSFEQIGSRLDTRTHVWQRQWETFMNYPIFGRPLIGDRLMGYGENSWLGAGAALGLLGFVPLVLFGFESIKMMLQLDRLAIKRPNYYFHCSVVIAGLGSLLLGSVAEAYLLGNITASLLALLLYQCLGTYLLELNQREQRLPTLKLDPSLRNSP